MIEEEQHIMVENIWLIYDQRCVRGPKLRTVCEEAIVWEITHQYFVWHPASCDGHVLTGYE
jgi:MinD superfamily P-loop ATPase